MTRNVATTVENNFVLGLITERTELRFPQNACTDIDNCVIDLYGRVSRRKGIDLEENYSKVTVDTGDVVYNDFVWEGAGGDSSNTYYVLQQGSTLLFFDISTSTDIGANKMAETIDLSSFVPSGSGEDPTTSVCDFTAGNGKLVVVSNAIDPVLIEIDGGDITATSITISERDFKGLDDGLDLIERPSSSLTDLISNNPEHYYNLLNQGWYAGDALTQWDTARADLPSNADQVALYRASATDAFNNDIVTSKSPGNIQAPKGHFILDAFNPSRSGAMTAEGFSATVEDVSTIDLSVGTNIGTFSNIADIFDADISTKGSASAGSAYVGKNYTTPGATTVAGVSVISGTQFRKVGYLRVSLYGSNTAPSNGTDGTLLGQGDLLPKDGNNPGPFTGFIASDDTTTTFKYFWINVSHPASYDGANTMVLAQVIFYDKPPAPSTLVFKRPQCVSLFNGRIFYAGTDAAEHGTRIYFSRIIEIDDHYGQCYSDNDPTSETFNDFLPSDGGVISIPDCGLITNLFATQNSLLCLATNGVWLVSGSSGQPFVATNYQVTKLSGIGSQSRRSIVDYKGTPIWWGDNGIYTTQYDPNFNSYTIVDLTQDSIRTFYNKISTGGQKDAKGTYDLTNDIIYFLYSDFDEDVDLPPNVYTNVLVFVPRSKAFYTWSFPDSDFYIRGFRFIQDGSRQITPAIKYTCTLADDDTSLYFAEVTNDTYKDWSTYATAVAMDNDVEKNYESYFATGYYIHGETQRFFQGNYLFVFLDQDVQGSCKVKTIYDWTTSGNSGKWSPEQQAYPDWQLLQKVNYRRLKTRGKGRAMQIYFTSEEGKPFSVIGWSVFESGNATI